jgi:hypothetical protein
MFNGGTGTFADTKVLTLLTAHEFGHTVHFIVGSAASQLVNPWVSNIALGAVGLSTRYGSWWEDPASAMGNDFIDH